MIGWRPADFWSATPRELFAAIDGWNRAHGARRADTAEAADPAFAAWAETAPRTLPKER